MLYIFQCSTRSVLKTIYYGYILILIAIVERGSTCIVKLHLFCVENTRRSSAFRLLIMDNFKWQKNPDLQPHSFVCWEPCTWAQVVFFEFSNSLNNYSKHEIDLHEFVCPPNVFRSSVIRQFNRAEKGGRKKQLNI